MQVMTVDGLVILPGVPAALIDFADTPAARTTA
jgi:hypothetical protein